MEAWVQAVQEEGSSRRPAILVCHLRLAAAISRTGTQLVPMVWGLAETRVVALVPVVPPLQGSPPALEHPMEVGRSDLVVVSSVLAEKSARDSAALASGLGNLAAAASAKAEW